MTDDLEDGYWNYRCVEFMEGDELQHGLFEVYYDKNHNITDMTAKPILTSDKGKDGLINEIGIARIAVINRKPITIADLEKAGLS